MEEMTELTKVRRDRVYLFTSRDNRLRDAWIPFGKDYKVISYTRIEAEYNDLGLLRGEIRVHPEINIRLSDVNEFMTIIQNKIEADRYAHRKYKILEFNNEEEFEKSMMLKELSK